MFNPVVKKDVHGDCEALWLYASLFLLEEVGDTLSHEDMCMYIYIYDLRFWTNTYKYIYTYSIYIYIYYIYIYIYTFEA